MKFQSLFFWNNLNNHSRWRGHCDRDFVSILILLEQSQQLQTHPPDHAARKVSILILLEQSQQLDPKEFCKHYVA